MRCCARPISFSDSTGNTQGIKFRIRPPTNAAPRAASSDIVGVVDGTAAAVPAAAVATAPATSGASTVAVQPPDFAGPPLATITPASDFESAFTGFTAVSVSASPLARSSTCAAAGSMRPSSSGKNSSLSAVRPAGSSNATLILLASTVPRALRPGSVTGTSLRASAKRAACTEGAACPLTGSVSFRSALPGMQTSLHSSHSAFAFNVTALPARLAGICNVVSNSVSPS